MEREKEREEELKRKVVFLPTTASYIIPQIPEIVTPPNPFIFTMMLLMKRFVKEVAKKSL